MKAEQAWKVIKLYVGDPPYSERYPWETPQVGLAQELLEFQAALRKCRGAAGSGHIMEAMVVILREMADEVDAWWVGRA